MTNTRHIGHLPLKVHYAIVDCLIYPLLYYVVRYRRALVDKNLRLSFPELDAKQLKTLRKKVYHHLADLTAEILYGFRATDMEMREHMEWTHVEMINSLARKYGGVIIMLGHLGNWEWIADATRLDDDIDLCSVYRPLNNHFADLFMQKARRKRGSYLVEKARLLREVVRRHEQHLPTVYGMVCDQKPSPRNAHFWMDFLHQDTSFLDGCEVIARRQGYPVVATYITSPKRGYYLVDFRLLSLEPRTETPFSITRRFAELLEMNIRQQPEMWLWTHNRWKWKRENEM